MAVVVTPGAPGVLLHAELNAVPPTSPAEGGAPQPVAADWLTWVESPPIHCSELVNLDERTPVPSFELQMPPPPSSLFSSFITSLLRNQIIIESLLRNQVIIASLLRN